MPVIASLIRTQLEAGEDDDVAFSSRAIIGPRCPVCITMLPVYNDN